MSDRGSKSRAAPAAASKGGSAPAKGDEGGSAPTKGDEGGAAAPAAASDAGQQAAAEQPGQAGNAAAQAAAARPSSGPRNVDHREWLNLCVNWQKVRRLRRQFSVAWHALHAVNSSARRRSQARCTLLLFLSRLPSAPVPPFPLPPLLAFIAAPDG